MHAIWKQLPDDLAKRTHSFVIRDDWRTCRMVEAELIKNKIVFYEEKMNSFGERVKEDVKTWTLFGQMYAVNLTDPAWAMRLLEKKPVYYTTEYQQKMMGHMMREMLPIEDALMILAIH